MKKKTISNRGYKKTLPLKRGLTRKKYPARRSLSAIQVISHKALPSKLFEKTHLTGKQLDQRRAARYHYELLKAENNRRQFKELYGRPIPEMDHKTLLEMKKYREAAKESLDSIIQLPLDVVMQEECRYRDVTIKECLTKVCADQKEYISIWGNWEAMVSEPLTVTSGEFPEFSISDCVDEGNGYSFSDGWIWVGASIILQQSARVKEFGLNFEGYVGADPDGEDHYISTNEWGKVVIESQLELRSITPRGNYTHLVTPGQRHQDFYEKNEWGPTTGHSVSLSNHTTLRDRSVLEDHVFMIDYTLFWEVSRSPGDYWSSACFGLNKLKIKPYIVYETCHDEYKEVSRFYNDLVMITSGNKLWAKPSSSKIPK